MLAPARSEPIESHKLDAARAGDPRHIWSPQPGILLSHLATFLDGAGLATREPWPARDLLPNELPHGVGGGAGRGAG